MREIVFDTETTGLSFSGGDRLVEIGCVELFNRVETGRVFHAYFNPGRPMPAEAQAVHGLSDAFLADKPAFHAGVDALLEFLGDSPLIAHNASFDFGFLNGELGLCKRSAILMDRMVDTLLIARSRHPGAKHTLDALCVRFGIDRSRRVLHGALLDAQLLAQVYVELMGGRQIGLGLASAAPQVEETIVVAAPKVRPPRVFAASDAELAAHAAFLETVKQPLWLAGAAG
ncbi:MULTISPECIES: DNA polymerase III subunit epsilon [Sphingomonas]|uniref:DNA polymerase III subunit epsilon n=1 Tax=Sphingomonas molluscorum TaxID=418184 RepID=A0ABU8Q1E4_9SPHN|nr:MULTISPECIES: DNA polymerase III subunit epsilon [unclassified Sphingomonas]GLK20184.1 DNA polymerase III subunit epsilon [Microbacterium terregens]MBM7404923.1 DNA polymerase-3 subunit epsilon [Sphingomonas sp. JUb134]MCG7346798.1 DNA polymerase III subunit epsilon [Sphingomonas sp. ACRSK]RSV15950.1 DNA polymerase III subunit epsilon [Sphingomonas sp. ABOLF]RSV16069.1 DNA polymerase III subunit epsilon [Sphingomonas sp. ABOLF]